jgi:zinc/manganese transport system substrate-binding protein
MFRIHTQALVLAGVAALAAVAAPAPAAAKVQVAATLPGLAAIARDVGGPDAEVIALSSPKQDPHFVDPRPDLVVRLNRTDLLIVNGLDLEVGWLPPLLTGARNPKLAPGGPGYLDASTLVTRLEVPAGPVDRARGDIHPGGNPHVLFDPRADAAIARGVGDRLAAVDPAHAAGYRARAGELAGRLEALAALQAARFRALPAAARRVVVYHRSFPYLEDWLGLEQVAELEPKPGIAPDPGHVAQVLATMRSTGARAILQEEFYPSGTGKTLAELAQAQLVVVPAAPRFADGEGIVAWSERLAEGVYRALAR